MNRHKCFADGGSYCKVLTEKMCEYSGCRFYKTEQQLYDERQAVDKYIEEKYGLSRREFVRRKYGDEVLKYWRRRNEATRSR